VTPKALATSKMSTLECSAQVQQNWLGQEAFGWTAPALLLLFIAGSVDATAGGRDRTRRRHPGGRKGAGK